MAAKEDFGQCVRPETTEQCKTLTPETGRIGHESLDDDPPCRAETTREVWIKPRTIQSGRWTHPRPTPFRSCRSCLHNHLDTMTTGLLKKKAAEGLSTIKMPQSRVPQTAGRERGFAHLHSSSRLRALSAFSLFGITTLLLLPLEEKEEGGAVSGQFHWFQREVVDHERLRVSWRPRPES